MDFIVGLLAQGWTQADILRNYPGVTHDDIAACLQCASETLQAEKVYPLTPAGARFLQRTIEFLFYEEFAAELLPGVVRDVDETEGVNRRERRYNSKSVTAEQSWGS